MTSNTSKGRGTKGSKYWMQTLVNLDAGKTLLKRIQSVDSSIGEIQWHSPLKSEAYAELSVKGIADFKNADLLFWPDNGPWWDAVGKDDKGTIILVEAKAHTDETKTSCTAKNPSSIDKIITSMKEAHDVLTSSADYGVMSSPHAYDKNVWFKKYYQLGNRFTFLVKLREQGYNVKLVLLNIVNDSTYKSTPLGAWENHYRQVFQEMIGTDKKPDHVVMVNVDVG